MKKRTIARDAKTGRIVTKKYAQDHPDTTILQKVSYPHAKTLNAMSESGAEDWGEFVDIAVDFAVHNPKRMRLWAEAKEIEEDIDG